MAPRSRWLVVMAAFTLLLMAGTGWAQTRSELTGTVKDITGAVLPGVTVTLTSPNLVGGAQTHVTNAAGVYRFADLPLGTYELDASLQGFQTVKRTGLRVAFGTTVTIDLVLPIGGVAETVIVSGATPVIDVKTAASTTKIDNDLLQSLPISGRAGRPQEIFAMSPGATTFRTAHGGMRDANNLMVDGMSSSVPGGNIRTSLISYNWMEEVQVVALGANAEYGEFTGTVSNMVMRSGSNRFSGMVEYVFSRPGWLADNLSGLSPSLQARFTPVVYQEDWDLSYQGGGPIVKDKLFFFAGGQYVRNSRNQAGAIPDDNGKVWPTTDTWPRYMGKVNWAASNSVKLEGYFGYDKDNIDSGGNANTAPSAAGQTVSPKKIANARLTWTASDKTLVEVRGGGFKFNFGNIASERATAPYQHTDTVWGYSWGNSGVTSQDYVRMNFTASVTKWIDNFVGKSHELKFGMDYEHTTMENGSH
ncbi:MAG: carboxypeptidase regulatory-like domain-containing protein, partial [Planctomycetes bacterium]|nr:carboxypeptidase regulatory-like domain-containing protein [Planctomycetota bacterium]